jgi:cell division septation protein DedD
MADDLVKLTVVSNELEADELCGLLQSEGIDSFVRPTDAGAGWIPGLTGSAGPREILVERDDLERAQELIAAPLSEDDAPDR